MKAAVVRSFDLPPKYQDFPDPVAGDGEILVEVKAAGLHQVVRALASGSHYGSAGILPLIPGVDGVGRLSDGKRVYFGATRPPYGTFAQLTVTRAAVCIPLPDGLDDVTAAALANPGMSSRAALLRAQFVAGENVLILGATGVAGRLAVQVARRHSAKRIVAAGRNPGALAELASLGANKVISLEQEQDSLVEAFRAAIAEESINVVLDYLWGQPAEAVLQAAMQKALGKTAPRIRFVQIGAMAGASISLQAAILRGSGLELLGSGFGSASREQIMRAVAELFQEAARMPFQIAAIAAPLSEIENLWGRSERGKRVVFQL